MTEQSTTDLQQTAKKRKLNESVQVNQDELETTDSYHLVNKGHSGDNTVKKKAVHKKAQTAEVKEVNKKKRDQTINIVENVNTACSNNNTNIDKDLIVHDTRYKHAWNSEPQEPTHLNNNIKVRFNPETPDKQAAMNHSSDAFLENKLHRGHDHAFAIGSTVSNPATSDNISANNSKPFRNYDPLKKKINQAQRDLKSVVRHSKSQVLWIKEAAVQQFKNLKSQFDEIALNYEEERKHNDLCLLELPYMDKKEQKKKFGLLRCTFLNFKNSYFTNQRLKLLSESLNKS